MADGRWTMGSRATSSEQKGDILVSRRFPNVRAWLLAGTLCLLCILAVVGCGTAASEPSGPGTVLVTAMLPTPTVDMASARQAFETGGELTYNEVIALRRDTVGDPPDPSKIDPNKSEDFDQFYAAQDAYGKREDAFAEQLRRCTLKESVGWIGWRSAEYGPDDSVISNSNRLYIFMSDPFPGPERDADNQGEMYIENLTDKQADGLKGGQRIRFSGNLTLADRHEAVENTSYTLLEDDPPVPTPAPSDLKDLQITLTRTMCYGSCPDYTLTIASDGGGGKVTFDGHYYTRVTGTATATISQAQLSELAREVIKADYFSLNDSYSENVTDLPTYTLNVQMGGRSKQVCDYGTGPRRLGILMDRIDQIVNTEQWIGHDAAR